MDADTRYYALVKNFDKLKLDTNINPRESDACKRKVIFWIKKKFPDCLVTQELLVYLQRDDISLKRSYYHREKGKVFFYFKVFDASASKIHRKKIVLVPK
jgi:hypothetical protein